MPSPSPLKSGERARFSFETLEPRLLYSADFGPSLLAAPLGAPAAEERVLATEIVFVDASVPNAEELLTELAVQSGRAIEVVRIGAGEDGLARIGAELALRQDIAAVHILSHGADGAVYLGRSVLDMNALEARAAELASWSAALTADADLLIYGCDAAATDAGRAMLERLAALTGADVNASADPTGAGRLGGNWMLEYRSGSIETSVLQAASWQGLLGAVPSGVETRVNSTVAPTQTEAAVAVGGNGNYVIVWASGNSQDGDRAGVYAQLYDAAGNPIGGEFKVNTYTTKDQLRPSAAMDASGNFVIVWASDGQDGDQFGVYGQRYSAAGVPQGAEFRINVSTTNQQDQPDVAMEASGNFVVVWQSNHSGSTEVYGRRFDATGAALSGEFLVNTNTANTQDLPTVAMNGAGAFVVAWKSTNPADGSGNGVFGQLYNAAGNTVGGEFQVNTTGSGNQDKARAAMAADGSFVIAWSSDGNQDGDGLGIFAQRFSAAGAKLGGEFRVNSTTADDQDFPSVAIDGAGNFTIAWQSNNQDGGGTGVYMRSFNATGYALGFETRVNSTTANDQALPAIGMRPNGDFVVAWHGNGPGDTAGIFAQRYLNQNAAPVNTVPGAQATSAAAPLVFSPASGNAISIADLDAGLNPVQVTLTAANGTLTLSGTAGLTFSAGDGIDDASMTFTGSVPDINAALEGLRFSATPFFSGAASLQIVTSDLGNSGPGGALSDSDTVPITVAATGTPFILSGSYVGNGLDDRALAGLGFQPDVVLIKARDSNKVAVIRTSAMGGDLSKEMTGGTGFLANQIQSLDADGFTVGTSDRVNASGTTYDWIAFRSAPGWMRVGTYSGDGVAGRTVSGLGFSPEAAFIFDAGNQEAVFRLAGGANEAYNFGNSNGDTTWITSLDGDGFTLGNNARVNALGRTYYYIAWNEIPGMMDVGSYNGDGLDNRNIAGVGFQPEWLMVKSEGGDHAVQHFDSQGPGTDSSSLFNSNSFATNRIQALQADGFQTGSDNDVNNAGHIYSYLAFRQQTAPTISDVPDQTINEDTASAPIAFTIGDAETAPDQLFVRAISSNPALVPDGNIVLGGSGANRTLTITPAAGMSGTATITLQVSDGATTVSDTFVLTVQQVNDPPTVSAPASIAVTEDVPLALTGISFSDPDAGSGAVVATFSVPQGALAAVSGGGVTVGGTALNLSLTGALTDINAFIAAGNLSYTPAANDTTAVTLAVSMDDQGNTGTDGAKSSGITNVTLNVTAVNDAPVNTVPGAQNTPMNTPVIFSTGNANRITVADVDAGGNPVEVTLSVSSGTLTLAGTAGLTFSSGIGTSNASMTFSGTLAVVNAALDGLRYDPTAGFSGSDTLVVTSNDLGSSGAGGAQSVANQVVLNVAFVNSAPVLSGANDLAAISEDPASNPGTLVAALIAGRVTDANAGALSGIAVIGVDNTNGSWQYSTDGGATWTAFGSPSASSARLLAADANSYVRFVPNAHFAGTVAGGLSFRAWDRSFGVPGGTADTVTPIANDVRDNFGTASYGNDDGSAAWTAGWVDIDANPNAGNIRIAGGKLVLSANTNADFIYREVNLAAASSATLSFTYDNQLLLGVGGSIRLEASGDGGASYATLATFSPGSNGGVGSFSADLTPYAATNTRIRFSITGISVPTQSMLVDDLRIAYLTPASGASTAFSAATASAGITVNAVNDAPRGTASTVTVAEDGTYTFSTADFGYADPNDSPANALVAVKISSLPSAGTLTNNGAAVVAGDFVSAADIAAGRFVFTPAANANGAGYASFGFQVQDDGGGSDLDPVARALTIDVTAVNDAPVGSDRTVTLFEDGTHVFGVADFGFADPDDSPANALLAVRISSLPTAGALSNNGVAVAAGQFVSAADIAAGRLVFAPAANASGAGYASFTFQVQDDGGGSDLDPVARTLSFDVIAVNDPPVGTDNTVTVLEDGAYVFSAADFGFTDPRDSPAGNLVAVHITMLPGAGTLALNGVAVAAGDVVSEADIAAGLLVYTPAANASGAGYASFGFRVQDDGGGSDLDTAVRTLTIDVTPVNDAPAGADATVAILEDSAHVFAAADFGFSDVEGNALAGVRISSLPAAGTLTNNGAPVSAGQLVSAADIAAGRLLYTPAANGNGVGYASFTFQVQDDGGTANGGVNLDPVARTLTVDVTAVNDAPTGTSSTLTLLEDTPHVFAAADFGFSDVDGNALAAVRITAISGAGSLTNNGLAVSAGQSVSAADIAAGRLVFTPAANASGAGYASVSFQVQDDGGTVNGGVDLDPVARMLTVDVTAVNDAPAGASNTITILEDGAHVFAAADFGFSDVDGNALAAVRISTSTSAGTLTVNGIAVTAGQTVSAADIAAGRLVYTPAANGNGAGYASFGFQVQDDGGTANGGVDLDPAARTLTIDVTAVNDAPAGADGTVATLQDTPYVFRTADFGFSDVDGNALAGVRIASLPAAGSLTENGSPVAAGQTISALSISLGLLKFTPAPGSSAAGYASFTFQVLDDGGTANGGADADPMPRRITIDIAAPPVITLPSAPPPPAGAPEPASPGDASTGPSAPSPASPFERAAETARVLLAADEVVITAEGDDGMRLPVLAEMPLSQNAAFVSSQRIEGPPPAALGLPGPFSLPEPIAEKALELNLFGLHTAADGSGSSGARGGASFADDLDRMRDDVAERAQLEQWITGSVAAGSFGLTVGYVLWLLRGGALLASLLSSLPAWRLIDPLPVLARADDDEEAEDDEGFDAVVAAAPAPREAPA